MKNAKMMNEKKAWKYLHECWSKEPIGPLSATDGYVHYTMAVKDIAQYGLCGSLTTLLVYKHINHKTYCLMKDKIYKYKTTKLNGLCGYCGYIWNLDIKGAKSRAAFCLRQYKKLKD